MKYHKFVKDGYCVPFNAELVGNPLFVEYETDEDPNPAIFHAPQSDAEADAADARALARARALVAKADAAEKEAAEAAEGADKPVKAKK